MKKTFFSCVFPITVSEEFESQMLKYVVAIHRKVHELSRDMVDIKGDLRGRSMSPASSQSSSSEVNTRSKIPCNTKQQLQELENMLESNPAAYAELVSCTSNEPFIANWKCSVQLCHVALTCTFPGSGVDCHWPRLRCWKERGLFRKPSNWQSRGQEVTGGNELAGDRYKVAIQRVRIRYRRSEKWEI